MRLHNHIAWRFLTADSLIDEFMTNLHGKNWQDLPVEEFAFSYDLLSRKNIDGKTPVKVYYVTNTVLDKLQYLKIRSDKGLDWTVFKHIGDCKKTLIMDGNRLLRIYIRQTHLSIALISFEKGDSFKETGDGNIRLTNFVVDLRTGPVGSEYHTNAYVKQHREFIYKLMCFYFLSENTEEIVKPGEKRGTQKTGKFINELPMPVTIVNSKWNITSIRTDGFLVSGHFRLQPCGVGFLETKMIWIDPFEKHGYKRTAGNIHNS